MGRPRITSPRVKPIIEVATLVHLYGIPAILRQFGMRVTVTSDPTTSNNVEWILLNGANDSDKTNNSNWVPTVLEIGFWDMSATSSVLVSHGVNNPDKIKGIGVMIRPDADALTPEYFYDLIQGDGGVTSRTEAQGGWQISQFNIQLRRTAGGFFAAGTDFNNPAFNRGWIHLRY